MLHWSACEKPQNLSNSSDLPYLPHLPPHSLMLCQLPQTSEVRPIQVLLGLGASQVWSETGLFYSEDREQPKKEAGPPYGQVASIISEETYIPGLSWASRHNLHIHLPESTGFHRSLNRFRLVPSRPQQHIAASKLCPWSSSSMEKLSTVRSPAMGRAEKPELPSWWSSPAFILFCGCARRWLGKCCQYQFCCCNYILASRWTYTHRVPGWWRETPWAAWLLFTSTHLTSA